MAGRLDKVCIIIGIGDGMKCCLRGGSQGGRLRCQRGEGGGNASRRQECRAERWLFCTLLKCDALAKFVLDTVDGIEQQRGDGIFRLDGRNHS